MTFSVNSGRPTRDAAHIARLFAHRSERLEGDYDAGFGVDMIRLAASSVSSLDARQLTTLETADSGEHLTHLFDRMSSRLGALAVVRTQFINTHIPERAVRLEPVIAPTPDDPLAAPDRALPRPLRLLPSPEPITVFAQVPDGPPNSMVWRRVSYKFVKASGPERLGAEWWRSGKRLQLVPPEADEQQRQAEAEKRDGLWQEPSAPVPVEEAGYREGEESRDYYIAEDGSGRRFWVFRQGLFGFAQKLDWFMQGFFS